MTQSHSHFVPERVHLVGSIGLGSVDEIFQNIGRVLGRRLKRVPDGEVGGRRHWISWQYPLLRSTAYLVADPSGAVHRMSRFPILALADGVKPEEIQFGELGYAREARSSYQDFCAARARGVLPSNVKFQVCLPTPMAVIYAFCREQDVLAIYKAYERDMVREVAAICAAIPHHDLCIQWDVCHEMLIWDGQPLDMFPKVGSSKEEIIVRLQRMCQAVPTDVELGIHLCYGDFRARHFLEPRDAGKMVELANALFAATKHSIAFLHMPVPIERTDDVFFTPLRELKLPPCAELYLGVVHAADGLQGTKKRIDTASKYVSDFGIATECGMARARTPDLVNSLIELHASASKEPASTERQHA
jgi:methionine synthase II (cobalamin-independent)